MGPTGPQGQAVAINGTDGATGPTGPRGITVIQETNDISNKFQIYIGLDGYLYYYDPNNLGPTGDAAITVSGPTGY
jgi:hypothetical protein